MLLRVFWALVAVGLLIPSRLLLPGASAKTGVPETNVAKQKSSSKAHKEITALVAKSEKAWNKGDLDAFLDDYLRSKEVTYISNGTVKRGFEAIRDHYVNRYGNNKASMGQLFLTELETSDLSDKHVLCFGKFTVVHHSHVPIYGRFSLIFVRTKAGWKIMYDHSSQ
jgi:hypothetical protein